MGEGCERPIIMSAPMVQATLDGRKTQTRRVLRIQPIRTDGGGWYCGIKKGWGVGGQDFPDLTRFCPYGAPGDRLWVRETWCHTGEGVWSIADARSALGGHPIYAATHEGPKPLGWWPSIHMPREFARILLEITEVRVERLQDISEADALSEGATMRPRCSGFGGMYAGWSMDWSQVGRLSWYARGATRSAKAPLTERDVSLGDPQSAFASYINTINGPSTWDTNPWVWAVSFKLLQPLLQERAG